MKYLRLFETDADYQSYIENENNYVEPHIALIKDSYSVVYKRKEPIELYTQVININSDWTWISFYLDTMEGENGLKLLQEALGNNGIEIMTSTTGYEEDNEAQYNLTTTYDTSTGTWTGNLTNIDLRYSYKINALEPMTIEFTGNLVNPENYIIDVHPKPYWSLIGYPINIQQSIYDAFISIGQDTDTVKTQGQFAQYFSGKWWGSLKQLEPSQGYQYLSGTETPRTIIFTNPPIVNTEAVSTYGLRRNVIEPNNHYNVTPNDFNDNMTMIALVDNVNNENYELGAFVNGECRGTTHPLYVDILDKWLFFIMIYGNVNDEEVTFKYYDNENGEEITLDSTVTFSKDKMLGHVNQPYIL